MRLKSISVYLQLKKRELDKYDKIDWQYTYMPITDKIGSLVKNF